MRRSAGRWTGLLTGPLSDVFSAASDWIGVLPHSSVFQPDVSVVFREMTGATAIRKSHVSNILSVDVVKCE